ncbi:4-hydroxy-tetrahydrodipicolinate synthase [Polluticaenibacter yanchengensis]|uniref:4-hydroxy-tetrahydrodipicolinate synthase n=1 Tax=Polluticaenibacter yanchengensis TaxID=3014562 RepID=A0ABT4UGH8_9BACT|nr:4-hydroxy-tetrahydrodipicolinate synthase [Chitinophagaceae bacterium LY-5]
MANLSLKGVGVAVITPFNEDLTVDYPALKNLLEYFIDSKIDYVVTLGTTGESATLTADEKIKIINFTYDTINGRIPVVVGVGGNNTYKVIEDLKQLPLDKAAAILSVSPYYNKPTQEGIYQHYAAIAKSTDKPIILYNVPGRTNSNILPETTYRLAADFKNIIAIKEASGNMVQCMHLVKNKPEGFYLISGDDHINLPLIACGFDGVISVVANSHAAEFSELTHLALNNEFQKARAIQDKLLVPMDLLFAENNPAGVKGFLAAQGKIKNILRLPLVPASEKLYQAIQETL